jgi:hypothetical protein
MTKNKFLSLEFIISDYTYWWTSDHKNGTWNFTKIPLSNFNGRVLHASQMNFLEDDILYSEMTEEEGGKFWFYEIEGCEPAALEPVIAGTLSWNEMARFVIDEISLEAATPFFYNSLVRKKDNCTYTIANTEYFVTAFLPGQVFAILGDNYSFDNPNWISIQVKNQEEFKEVISQFYIYAIRNSRKEWIEV